MTGLSLGPRKRRQHGRIDRRRHHDHQRTGACGRCRRCVVVVNLFNCLPDSPVGSTAGSLGKVVWSIDRQPGVMLSPCVFLVAFTDGSKRDSVKSISERGSQEEDARRSRSLDGEAILDPIRQMADKVSKRR